VSPTPVRRRLRRLLVAGALPAVSALAAPTLRAQVAPATTVASAVARLEGIPDAGVRRAIAEALSDADRRRLPLEPLVAKALEGVEKRADPARIEAAVRGMAGRLATSKDALAPAITDVEVTAGADALAAGVPAEVLRRLRALSPRRSTAVALGVLGQLVSRGVPVPQAATAVTRLVQGRASDGQLLAVEREVQSDLSQGIAAVTAIELRTRPLIAILPGAPGAATTASEGLVGPASAPAPPKTPARGAPATP
jgi:hypothetical protein